MQIRLPHKVVTLFFLAENIRRTPIRNVSGEGHLSREGGNFRSEYERLDTVIHLQKLSKLILIISIIIKNILSYINSNSYIINDIKI
jgi:hypothetical protein